MFRNLFDRFRRAERVASVAPYKPDPMREVDKALGIENAKPDLAKPPLDKPARTSNGFDKAAFFARLREGLG